MNCDNCGQTEFNILDGYYFCTECGTQTQLLREFEFDTQNDSKNELKLPKPVKTDVKMKMLTTFEEGSIILLGIVNDLVNLGASDEFKLTSLKIYAQFLRSNEIAFFSKEQSLPKLPMTYRKKDAQILYNRYPKSLIKRERSETSHSAVSESSFMSTNSQKKRQSRKAAADFMKSEYNSSFKHETSDSDTSACTSSIRLNYSSVSRKKFKKVMHKKHIDRHEREPENLKCHKLNPQCEQCAHVKPVNIFSIIFLALNYTQSHIQIVDVIRFIREHHIPYSDFNKYFPEEHKSKLENFSVSHDYLKYQSFLEYSHNFVKAMNFESLLRLPDFNMLCKRYVTELCLPPVVLVYVERLIALCPSKMENYREYLPSYEGRAMAYIIFVLKLIFGLNDSTEILMSRSVGAVNEKFGADCLFSWCRWQEYIEMRRIIIQQCHYPTAHIYDPNSKITSELNMDFKRKMCLSDNSESQTLEEGPENFKNILRKLQELHASAADLYNPKRTSLTFDPSFTPFHDYLKYIMDLKPTDIHIPDFMHLDHTKLNLDYFMKVDDLNEFLGNKGIKLDYREIDVDETVAHFVIDKNYFRYYKHRSQHTADMKEVKFVDEDSLQMKYEDIMHIIENKVRLHGEDYPLYHTPEMKSYDNKFVGKSDATKKIKKSIKKDTIPFYLNNFQYWIKLGDSRYMPKGRFIEIQSELPRNFNWLLNMCALSIEMNPEQLYNELVVIENYFLNVRNQPTQIKKPKDVYKVVPYYLAKEL